MVAGRGWRCHSESRTGWGTKWLAGSPALRLFFVFGQYVEIDGDGHPLRPRQVGPYAASPVPARPCLQGGRGRQRVDADPLVDRRDHDDPLAVQPGGVRGLADRGRPSGRPKTPVQVAQPLLDVRGARPREVESCLSVGSRGRQERNPIGGQRSRRNLMLLDVLAADADSYWVDRLWLLAFGPSPRRASAPDPRPRPSLPRPRPLPTRRSPAPRPNPGGPPRTDTPVAATSAPTCTAVFHAANGSTVVATSDPTSRPSGRRVHVAFWLANEPASTTTRTAVSGSAPTSVVTTDSTRAELS
jgi:hypothetical protein